LRVGDSPDPHEPFARDAVIDDEDVRLRTFLQYRVVGYDDGIRDVRGEDIDVGRHSVFEVTRRFVERNRREHLLGGAGRVGRLGGNGCYSRYVARNDPAGEILTADVGALTDSDVDHVLLVDLGFDDVTAFGGNGEHRLAFGHRIAALQRAQCIAGLCGDGLDRAGKRSDDARKGQLLLVLRVDDLRLARRRFGVLHATPVEAGNCAELGLFERLIVGNLSLLELGPVLVELVARYRFVVVERDVGVVHAPGFFKRGPIGVDSGLIADACVFFLNARRADVGGGRAVVGLRAGSVIVEGRIVDRSEQLAGAHAVAGSHVNIGDVPGDQRRNGRGQRTHDDAVFGKLHHERGERDALSLDRERLTAAAARRKQRNPDDQH
jgi:hypothetical protein